MLYIELQRGVVDLGVKALDVKVAVVDDEVVLLRGGVE